MELKPERFERQLAGESLRPVYLIAGAETLIVQELADALPISRPAVSRHLRLLTQAGLVIGEPRGTRHVYRLDDAGVAAVEAYLKQVWGEAAARFRLVAENTTDDESR